MFVPTKFSHLKVAFYSPHLWFLIIDIGQGMFEREFGFWTKIYFIKYIKRWTSHYTSSRGWTLSIIKHIPKGAFALALLTTAYLFLTCCVVPTKYDNKQFSVFVFAYLFWHVLTPINELERTLIQVEKFIREREPSQANNVTGPGRVGPRRSVPGPGRWPPPVPFNSDPGIRAKVATLAILADSILVDALWQLARLLTTFMILPYFIQKFRMHPPYSPNLLRKERNLNGESCCCEGLCRINCYILWGYRRNLMNIFISYLAIYDG